MKNVPTKQLTVEGSTVNVQVQPELNLESYVELLKKKMDHYMTQLRILRVVNTQVSTTAMTNIVEYFQKRENYMLNREKDVQLVLNDPTLVARMQYLKTLIDRRNKTFAMRMAQIANDDKISQLNSAQQADYLRTVDSSRNTRGLARRALNQGIDFNEVARKEVRQMSEHIDELKNVDDNDHNESFYSRATTLGGIRAICELVKEDLLDDLDANDILLMLNIVGIPCSSPIGDYPDPMTWRITELHLGWYVSLSDVLTAYVQSNGDVFKTPATEKTIDNVIPVFEDRKIAHFLRKYAPSLLEYNASIGMRRIIADVPMTCGYTLCAAVWKMMEELNKKKTELHLKSFERLVLNYEYYVGGYFKHILPFIKEQNNNKNSYYLANNGTTNMISPLITLYRENDGNKLKYIPDILRALYTYEIWQAIRRLYKNQDNSDAIIAEMLTKLLGIDKEKNKTSLTPLYSPEPELSTIKFCDAPIVNETYFKELSKSFFYTDYIALFPKFLPAAVHNQMDTVASLPALTKEMICQELNITYDLNRFKLYNIVQALLFTTKASRVDTDENVMKIIDLKYEEQAKKMVSDYIRKQFEELYSAELKLKKKTEERELAAFLVESILKATTRSQVVDLMRNGVSRGVVTHQIVNSSSRGFKDLKTKLADMKEDVPLRADIIRLFLLGRDHLDQDNIVWNNGGVTFVTNMSEFAKIFETLGRSDEWNVIFGEYKDRGVHLYRTKVNHHGHSNEKPSYYAFGYPTLQHFKNDVTEEEFKKYCSVHVNCCGVPQLLALLNG